jgi:predicted dehydrogenase
MTPAGRADTVALIGANGHGRWHRREIARLQHAGAVRLVGLCDLAPIRAEPGAPVPPGARCFTDHRELLSATRPDVAVICTPPHTHLEIAAAAARAGADLLLEKPPVTGVCEHGELSRVLAETGRVCQVGFQALGSAALAQLTGAIAAGALGQVTGIGAAGAWQRPDSYYRRAPWAGRRWLDGRPVLDGALVNPFAHAVMQCLVLAEAASGAPLAAGSLEVERYRARPIDVDDTAVLRLRPAGAPPVVVAVSLCGDEFVAGEVVVHAERGRVVLWYTEDRLRLPGDPQPRSVPGRTGLLDNLLAHRTAPDNVPLLAPLDRTALFTAVVEAVAGAGEPAPIPARYRRESAGGGDRTVTVPGASRLLRRAADRLALPSELGVPWAAPAYRVTLAPPGPVPHGSASDGPVGHGPGGDGPAGHARGSGRAAGRTDRGGSVDSRSDPDGGVRTVTP